MYEPYVKVLPKEVSVKVAEVSENKNTEEKTWKVCGSLCTLNDVLCNEITLKGLEKGAILVFERTGAYSAMEGMALFLSHELPGVVLYSEEEGWIRARVQQETYELNMVGQAEEKMEELLEILNEIDDSIDYENETALIDDQLLDSFAIITLVSELEDAFDISIEASEMMPVNFNSAKAIWAMVQRLQED